MVVFRNGRLSESPRDRAFHRQHSLLFCLGLTWMPLQSMRPGGSCIISCILALSVAASLVTSIPIATNGLEGDSSEIEAGRRPATERFEETLLRPRIPHSQRKLLSSTAPADDSTIHIVICVDPAYFSPFLALVKSVSGSPGSKRVRRKSTTCDRKTICWSLSFECDWSLFKSGHGKFNRHTSHTAHNLQIVSNTKTPLKFHLIVLAEAEIGVRNAMTRKFPGTDFEV